MRMTQSYLVRVASQYTHAQKRTFCVSQPRNRDELVFLASRCYPPTQTYEAQSCTSELAHNEQLLELAFRRQSVASRSRSSNALYTLLD